MSLPRFVFLLWLSMCLLISCSSGKESVSLKPAMETPITSAPLANAPQPTLIADSRIVPSSKVEPLEQVSAREWIDGILNLDGNKVLKYTCLDQRENVQDLSLWTSSISAFSQLLVGQKVDGDVSDLKFKTISKEDTSATVRVYGELRIAVLAVAEAHQLDEQWHMTYENDTWRWCGSNTYSLPLVPDSNIRRIAFYRREGSGESDIYTMNIDGSTRKNLTNQPAADWAPAWSPDGRRIAFISTRSHGFANIYIMDADGSNIVQLTDNSRFSKTNVSWAPDGKHIAFQANDYSNNEWGWDIFVIKLDRNELINLTNHPADDSSWFSWSPDGQQLVFESNRDGNKEVYLVNVDGSNLRNLSNHPAEDETPNWAPNGHAIAFTSTRDGNRDGYVLDLDTGELRNLTDHPAEDHFGLYSPDGTRLIFVTDRDGNLEIYSVTVNGDEQINLTNHPAKDYGLYWSPDGKQIAFVSDRDGILQSYVMEADGSNIRKIPGMDSALGIAWAPK